MTKEKYEVGYCNPPREHQFQKGRSGNPRGRPKRQKTLDTILDDVFEAAISSTDASGRKRTITVTEALLRTLVKAGLKGDKGSLKLALDYRFRMAAERHLSPEEMAWRLHLAQRAMNATVTGGVPIEADADNDNDPESAHRPPTTVLIA